MKKTAFLFIFSFLLLAACNNNHSTTTAEPEHELTATEQAFKDSLSRTAQKKVTDSLKKENPLLILPPDSTYTGDYTDKYSSGIIKFKGYFRFGKRHGQWMSFYPNGEMWSEMHYDKGLREGPNKAFYVDGKPRITGFYKHDMQDSVWCYYDSLGVIAERVLYKRDRVVQKLPLK